MIDSIVAEYQGKSDSIVLTYDHLYLTFGYYPNRYVVDLIEGEHKFFVRYFSADIPLLASYLFEDGRNMELEVGVIDFLEGQEFIHSFEIFNKELQQRPTRSQDLLLIINMDKPTNAEIE
ncbi:hypothetical protein ACBZ91_18660 [Vibrio natriegens]|uniref:hypothetical protein n=1 Tax=Vibrio natriegens TaxID=691 RepID=UPI003556D17B